MLKLVFSFFFFSPFGEQEGEFGMEVIGETDLL